MTHKKIKITVTMKPSDIELMKQLSSSYMSWLKNRRKIIEMKILYITAQTPWDQKNIKVVYQEELRH